jgi:hypothetical protein
MAMGSSYPVLWVALAALLMVSSGDKKKEAKEDLEVTVTDQQDKTTVVEDPVVLFTKRSILGETDETAEFFHVRHGKGTLKVKFEKIETLRVLKAEGETITIEVKYRGDPKPVEFILQDCQCRFGGKSKYGEFEIKVAEVKTLEFRKKPKEEEPKKG